MILLLHRDEFGNVLPNEEDYANNAQSSEATVDGLSGYEREFAKRKIDPSKVYYDEDTKTYWASKEDYLAYMNPSEATTEKTR